MKYYQHKITTTLFFCGQNFCKTLAIKKYWHRSVSQKLLVEQKFTQMLLEIFTGNGPTDADVYEFFVTFIDISYYASMSMAKWQIGTSGKNWPNPFSWGIRPKPLQLIFDLDSEALGGPFVYIPSVVHLKAYKLKRDTRDRLANTTQLY